MERSFAMRRAEIETKHSGIKSLFDRFPFLQEINHVSCLILAKN